MSLLETLTLAAYFLGLAVLAVYGWHRCYLVWLHMRHPAGPRPPAGGPDYLPRITVQLPLFNEVYVAERVIDAACGLDYPRDRLDIQVLDDSTDETAEIARRAVARWAAGGLDISYVRREERTGFKAGALEHGLRTAKGELVAVFDADFVPPPDFLRRSAPYFADPGVAVVQARWGHLNRDFSLLTRLQAMLLDAHFVLEYAVRSRAGWFSNFNGTAGLWRVTAILDAGGWEHDTLTEDLDLSYRAQLRGWRFVFLPDVVVPAELPVEVNGFKSQQRRWARGAMQTSRKLLPRILTADLPTAVQTEAVFHLTANANHAIVCLLAVLLPPAVVIRHAEGLTGLLWLDLPLFLAALASVGGFYLVSERELHRDWMSRLSNLPMLMALGTGLALNNTRAVLGGLLDRPAPFVRTPKYSIEGRGDDWTGKKYRLSAMAQPMIELALGLYLSGTLVYALGAGIWPSVPLLALFTVGFLYTGFLSLLQQVTGGVVLKPVVEKE